MFLNIINKNGIARSLYTWDNFIRKYEYQNEFTFVPLILFDEKQNVILLFNRKKWLFIHYFFIRTSKCERGTSLHAVQQKWQPDSDVLFCSYYFKNSSFRHFSLMFCGTANLVLFLACSFFCCWQNQGFCSYKIVLFKKRVMYKMLVAPWQLAYLPA